MAWYELTEHGILVIGAPGARVVENDGKGPGGRRSVVSGEDLHLPQGVEVDRVR